MSVPPVSNSSRVRELCFADCDQLSELVSGGDVRFVQLGAGLCQGSMRRIDLDGLYLLLTEVTNRHTCQVASQKGLRVVHIPFRWSRSQHWNGRELERPGVIVWGDSCDYFRVGEDVRTVALVIDESMLRQQIEFWAESSHATWDALHGQMLADTPSARHFMQQVEWVIRLAAQSPESFSFPEVRAQLREQLLTALVDAVEAGADRVPMGEPIARHRSRIVRRMADYLDAHPDRLMGLSDLCSLTGFSARSIAHACQTVLQTSPMSYLKKLRLNRVRRILRDAAPGELTVSECAYLAGFAHLGRFSAEYRKHFGELPSETLRRPR